LLRSIASISSRWRDGRVGVREDADPSAAWWLPGAHLQTVWARLSRSRTLVTFQREVLTTDDDDDLALDHLPGPAGSPRVLLLHGLEGSAHSLHTQGLAHLVARAGWSGTVINFRSCARDPHRLRRRLRNRRPRLYHAGEIGDLDFVIRVLRAREPTTLLYAIGFSLGGNVLLRWLGEAGGASVIRAAATISAPYDLAAAAAFLERPVGRFYGARFMNRLRAKALDLLMRFPRETAHLNAERIRTLRTLREFDQHVTAPLHGFPSTEDYYVTASSLRYLARITVPTLCISSTDDPFFPAEAVERAREASSSEVTFAVPTWGGHTGFVAGRWPWRPIYWAEERSLAWLQAAHRQAARV
jgi:predicted alpha/beta-fold hydrolase